MVLIATLLFMFIWQIAQSKNTALAMFKQVILNEKVIEPNIVNILEGKTKGDYLEAKQQVIEITLINLNLLSWSMNSSLNSITIFGDIYPAEGNELIVTVSLGKDKGVLAIFGKTLTGYKLIDATTNLVPINGLSLVQLKGMPYKSLVVDEYLDEMFGAFYKVKTRAIYTFKGNVLIKLWERELYREEYFPEGYEMKGDKTQWLLKKEVVNIAFLPSGNIRVSGKTSWGMAKVLGDLFSDYIITSTEDVNEIYVWDVGTLTFRKYN